MSVAGAVKPIRKRFYCGRNCGTVIGHMVWRPSYKDGFRFEPNERYGGVQRSWMVCATCAEKSTEPPPRPASPGP